MFPTVYDFLVELKKISVLANLTICGGQKLLKREILEFFLSGLNFKQREIASILGILTPEGIVEKLGSSNFISGNFRDSIN